MSAATDNPVVSGKRSPTLAILLFLGSLPVSRDGKQHADSRVAGESYDIFVSPSDALVETDRKLCAGCGLAGRFAANGPHLIYASGVNCHTPPSFYRTIGLFELATGKTRAWREDLEQSISPNTF